MSRVQFAPFSEPTSSRRTVTLVASLQCGYACKNSSSIVSSFERTSPRRGSVGFMGQRLARYMFRGAGLNLSRLRHELFRHQPELSCSRKVETNPRPLQAGLSLLPKILGAKHWRLCLVQAPLLMN